MQQARSKADEPQHQAKRRKQSSSELQKLKPPLRLDHELSRFRLSWTARARLCMPRRKPVWPVAIQTLTPLGSGSSPPQVLEDRLQRLTVDVAVNANTTAAAKLDLDDSSPCALRRRRTR